MSSLLFVESNTTGTGMIALTRARALGYEPILVTADPSRYRGLAETGAGVLVRDTASAADIAAALDPSSLAGVTTTSEYYLPVVAELAEKFALPGNPPAAMRAARDKAAVRDLLARAEVGQPSFAVVDGLSGLDAALATVGLPCVVKPVDESGSLGVRLCASREEAAEQVEVLLAVRVNVRGLPRARSVLLEEYVTGREFSVELFGGSCIGVTQKSVGGAPWFVETGHVFPAPLPDPVTASLVDTARRAVAAVGITMGPTHTEIRLGARGPAVIEINGRLAGGMIPELIRLATGVDLLEQQIRAAAGLPVDLTGGATGRAGIAFLTVPAPGVLTGVAGVEAARAIPGVHAVTVTAAPGASVRPPRDAYDRLGHVIAVGTCDRAVRDSLNAARETIRLSLGDQP
ncbi:argininosuccinate lyase [Actinorhabdospora filicis]|uniref:Argininosuccinate lyase n=1 Tax=Actinorhabdospora filicis TaxID=1785913 RepID=A0A9W6WAD8_9ACTN|nr:ATP-grasp domain-containing protein [Actinorhabdospora filicis]GLZ77540.1 argininosuccinate lyase [Actinorhabdospora filicis]